MSGISFASVAALIKELKPEEQEALVSSDNRRRVKQFLRSLLTDSVAVYRPVVIDYDKSFVEMVEAAQLEYQTGPSEEGRLKRYFPIEGKGQVEVKLRLVHLNRKASTEEVLASLEVNGLAPAKIEHLIVFCQNFPDSLGKRNLLALGSVKMVEEQVWLHSGRRLGYDRHVAEVITRRIGKENSIRLGWQWDNPSSKWGERDIFLAIEK